jgi:hypothetical protein
LNAAAAAKKKTTSVPATGTRSSVQEHDTAKDAFGNSVLDIQRGRLSSWISSFNLSPIFLDANNNISNKP